MLTLLPLALALSAAASGAGLDEASCPDWRGEPVQLRHLEERLIEVVNQQRIRAGRRTLQPDDRLSGVARAHARALAARGRMGHASDDGKDVGDRVRAAGIHDFRRVGENLATASTLKYRARDVALGDESVSCHDVESLARDLGSGWARSPGHRDNLLDRRYAFVGSGVAYDPDAERVYAVHVFAGGRAWSLRDEPGGTAARRASRADPPLAARICGP